VFITGVEEGLIPHSRSLDDPEGMAEERRLLYVGLTRAEDYLYLTYAFKRMTYGTSNANVPSRFLGDIPTVLTQGLSPRVSGAAGQERYRQDTSWDRTGSSGSRDSGFGGKSHRGGNGGDGKTGNSDARSKIMPFPGQQQKKLFPVGQRVFHSKFGAGLVIESRGSGEAEEVAVAFEDKQYGIKRFLASFGNLAAIKD
jgi:DNA helicase-2/ATP-dependent DNA helicase PcrA